MRRVLLRRARVLLSGRNRRSGGSGGAEGRVRVVLLEGPLSGEEFDAVLYSAFDAGDEAGVGGEVVVNTVGVEMGLGTGGVVFVTPGPEAGANDAPVNRDHFVKLPYTPLQFPAMLPRMEGPPGTEEDPPLLDVPVVVLPLHSHLAPACCAAARAMPGCRVAFVWQEGGALAVEFSASVEELKRMGVLGRVISSGPCFGGDEEAPNIYSALEVAARGGADLVLAGIGPGVVGTATRYGHGGMSAAIALNAAIALGARPVLAPRISSSDGRERHRGVSHHTRAALSATLDGCRVAFPESAGEYVGAGGGGRHEYLEVEAGAGGLEEEFGVTFQSMGRGYGQDPGFFDAAAAAVVLALSADGRGPSPGWAR